MRHRSKYLDYKDYVITIFNDFDKCMLVFLTDNGHTKSVDYDSNFFYVEELIDTYYEMAVKSFKGWRNKDLDLEDLKEIKRLLKKFIAHLKRQCEIDLSCVRKETKEVLYL